MAQLKKNLAGLALKGISILGFLFGFSCVFPIIMIFFMQRDDLDLLWLWLLLSGSLVLLGAWLMYDSCLMFRKKSFRAIKSIPAVLAYFVFGSVVDPLYSFAETWVSGIQARTAVGLASCFAALVSAVLVYLICTRLLKKLVEVAYGPQKISETQHSTYKQ